LNSFSECTSLSEVTFSADSHRRGIKGFQECTSLCRIDIPASVETLGSDSFDECTSLSEVIFSADSHLTLISAFGRSTSLCGIDIPASVKIIVHGAFNECISLNEVLFSVDSHLSHIAGFLDVSSNRELIFSSGTLIKTNSPGVVLRAFVVYLDLDDLKQRRRRIHLGTLCSMMFRIVNSGYISEFAFFHSSSSIGFCDLLNPSFSVSLCPHQFHPF
jgi:hypothetical protein